jgi:hypothetical protein
VERQLGGLPGRSDEEQERDPERGGAAQRDALGGEGEGVREVERTELPEDQEHAEQEREVPDPVHDEGLLAGVGVDLLLVPEPDQQVRAEAHAFPAHEQEREAVSEDQHEHREREQVQVREEAPEAVVLAHVADRIDVDQEADAGHDQHHDRRQRIHLQPGRDLQIAGRDPAEEIELEQALVRRHPQERQEDPARDREGGAHDARTHERDDALPQATAQQAVHQEAGQRQCRHEPDDGQHQPFRTLKSEMSTLSRRRNMATTIASPTAASAAATVIVKKTMT